MEMAPSGDLEIDFEMSDGVWLTPGSSPQGEHKATQRDRLPFSVLREQWLKRWQCRFLFYEPVTSPDAAQFIGGRVTCASAETEADRFSNGPRPSATFLTSSAVVSLQVARAAGLLSRESSRLFRINLEKVIPSAVEGSAVSSAPNKTRLQTRGLALYYFF